MKEKSIKKNAFLNTLKTFLTLFFPLITFPYSSRILGPSILGQVNFAQGIVSYFSLIASLGLHSYAVREIAKNRDDKQKMNAIVRELWTINLVSTVISYVLLFLTVCFVTKLHEYKGLIIICSTLIMFNTFGLNWLYEAFEEYTYITIRSLIFQVISVILLFTIVRSSEDYLQYAAVNIISNVGANILNLFHARKFISLKKNDSEKLQIKRHLKPVFILFASAIAATFFSSLDTTMLGFLSSDEQVGFYSAGAKIVRMVKNLFPAVTAVMIPRIAYYLSKDDEKSILELEKKAFNFLICFALPISAGFLLLMKPLVLLLCGEHYVNAILVSKIMSPFIICSAISTFTCSLLVVYGMERYTIHRMAITAVVDFVLNFILIPKYGANGAAVATLIAEILFVVIDCAFLRKYLAKIQMVKSIIQFSIALIIMCVCVYFSRNLFENLVLQLVTGFTAGVISYGGVLVAMRNQYVLELFSTIIGTVRGKLNKCNH